MASSPGRRPVGRTVHTRCRFLLESGTRPTSEWMPPSGGAPAVDRIIGSWRRAMVSSSPPLSAVASICLAICWTFVGPGTGMATPLAQKSGKQTCTIVVNKADNSLKLYENSGVLVGRYPVATGLYKCTVEGAFRVTDKHVISRTGGGALGTHWIGLNTKGRRRLKQVGIHGTNRPDSIGKFASNGCIRMRNEDVAVIYALVAIGSKVHIVSIATAAPRQPAPQKQPPAPQVTTSPIPPPTVAPVAQRRAWWNAYLKWGHLVLPACLLGLLVCVLLRSRSRTIRVS